VVPVSSRERAIPKSVSFEKRAIEGDPRRGVDQDVGRLEVQVTHPGEVELLEGRSNRHEQRRSDAGGHWVGGIAFLLPLRAPPATGYILGVESPGTRSGAESNNRPQVDRLGGALRIEIVPMTATEMNTRTELYL
jgi:hypothetical protein